MHDEELEAARDEAYLMGQADGKGDLPDEVRAFLEDLINHDAFRQLGRDLQRRARRLAKMQPEDWA